MANTVNGSTFYVDTQYASSADDYEKKPVHVAYITITATGVNGRIVLADVASGATKIDLRLAAANTSDIIHFRDKSMVFPNGVRVVTLTNMVATLGLTNIGS